MNCIRKLLVTALLGLAGVLPAHGPVSASGCHMYLATRLAQAGCYDVDDHDGFRVVATATCRCSIYARKVYGQWWGQGGWSTASLPSSWYNAGWGFVYATVQWYH